MKTFAERLKRARENSGYKSAESFANDLGVNAHAYRKYERGEAEPHFETISRICNLLGITPNELLPYASRRRGRDNSRQNCPA